MPGPINYFAGDGSLMTTYSDASLPTNVSINPGALATDSHGNVYIASGQLVYMVYAGGPVPTALANVTTTAGNPAPVAGLIYQVGGASGNACDNDQDQDPTCGEGNPFNQARFTAITSMVFDSADDLFICDSGSYVIREVAAQSSKVTTIAGTLNTSGFNYTGDGAAATQATFYYNTAIALDNLGNLYVVDYPAVRVVYSGTAAPPILAAEGIIAPANAAGTINTVAGQNGPNCQVVPTFGDSSTPGACGDYGPAIGGALLFNPNSVAVDLAGNIYLLDGNTTNSPPAAYVRIIYATGAVPPLLNLALNQSGGNSPQVAPMPGYIYAVTGYDPNVQFAPCAAAPCGDGQPPAKLQFGIGGIYAYYTQQILLDGLGNAYISDPGDAAVRKIDTSLIVSTIAGEVQNPATGPVNDPNVTPSAPGGPATKTQISQGLVAIAIDCLNIQPTACTAPANSLYISDVGYSYTVPPSPPLPNGGTYYEPGYLVWVVAGLLPQIIDNFPATATATYGEGSVALTATATSNLPVSYSITASPANSATLTCSTPGAQPPCPASGLVINGPGSVVITATQAGNTQYSAATPATQTLTIGKALLTVGVDEIGLSKETGQPNPPLTPIYSGFIGSDTFANSITGQPTLSTTAGTNSPPGTYPVTVSQNTLASAKYTFALVPGTLTITGTGFQSIAFPQPLNIIFGQPPIVTLAATSSSGLPVQYSLATGSPANPPNGSALTITGTGTVTVTAVQNGNETYAAATPVQRTFTVSPAPLTSTGPTVTQVYGTPVDPASFPAPTITGAASNVNPTLLVTGGVQYTTVATQTSNAGTYPITTSQDTQAVVPSEAANYYLLPFVPGQLIITPESQTINLNHVQPPLTYGTLVPLVATATSGLPVAYTLTGPGYFYNGINTGNLVQVLPTGVGTITVTATQPGTVNIGAAPPITQAFTIGPAPLNIGVAQEYSVQQGAAFPIFQPIIGNALPNTPGGFVNNDSDIPSVITGLPLLTTNATPSSPPGTYTITPSQGTLAAPNYFFVYQPGTLLITPPGSFAITSSPASLTIPTGLSAQATLTINPSTPYTDANGNPQISLYQGTVTLSCGTVPANVTCTISPSTYTFPGNQAAPGAPAPFENPALGTITISASGATVVGSVRKDDSISGAATLLIPGALAGLLHAFARKRATRHSRVWGAVLFLALGAGLLGISSCGGSSKSLAASPGTATVVITGSGTTVTGNGTVTTTLPLTVTIQ